MELGLGTVQFGIPYGISNTGGQTSPAEAALILAEAAAAGVRLLDTAPGYGSSERVLGALPTAPFRVVSKVSKLPAGLAGDAAAGHVLESARASLRALNRSSLAGLLVHDAGDLLGPQGDAVWGAFERLRAEGLVERCGASVYRPAEAEELLRRYPVRLLQFPMSYLDQRFAANGLLARLKQAGVELHVRSAFLQGLLLMDPGTLAPQFEPVRAHLAQVRAALAGRGLSPLEGALAYLAQVPELDVVLCGVNSLAQWREILAASRARGALPWASFAWPEERILLPFLWEKS